MAHLNDVQPNKLQRPVEPFVVHITLYGSNNSRCEHHDSPCSTPCTSPLRQPLPTPTRNGQYAPGHSAGGRRHTHPAQQVQGSRHLPAQCRIPHPWTAPTRTPTQTHSGGQTAADGRRGKKGHQRALVHITVQPTAHLPKDFGTERHIVLKGQAYHIITAALYTLAAHEHHWDPTTILAMPPPPQGPKEPATPLHINQLLRCRATPHLHPS